jgi:hypothetical protein
MGVSTSTAAGSGVCLASAWAIAWWQLAFASHNLRFVTVLQRFEIIHITCGSFPTLDGKLRQGFRITQLSYYSKRY